MTEIVNVLVADGTHLRRGGSTKGDADAPNVITNLSEDWYAALAQCAGQDVAEDGASNYWWVLIETPYGRGWVSSTCIKGGGGGGPLDGLMTAPTVYESPATDTATTIHVVSAGAQLYRGGSTRSEPWYQPVQIPGGPVSARGQCGGEDFDIGSQFNFRWVYVTGPGHAAGWVSAVQIREGGNDDPIPGVPSFPTVFAIPQGL